jgi:galactonate dehydratase
VKIDRIKSFLVDRFLLVRVYTDEGIIGNGEAGLWAHHETVHRTIEELADYYVGADPLLIEHHFQAVARQTHFMGAVLSAAQSAIDVALWDILGKSVGLPVYQLLGGKCREKALVFANVMGDSIEARGESAAKHVEEGFSSLRTTPFLPGSERESSTKVVKSAVQIVASIREAAGDEIDLGVEIHRNLSPDEAVMLGRELQPFRLRYFEDPVGPESIQALEYVARHIDIPIAAGERSYNIQQFKELIDTKGVALIRPDVSLAGGFLQCRKIAAIAESSFVGVFPHLMGSPVNNAVFAQFAAAIPNFVVNEYNVKDPSLDEIVDEPLAVKDGYRLVPDRPGIGVEIQEDKLSKFPFKPLPPAPSYLRADGSVTR